MRQQHTCASPKSALRLCCIFSDTTHIFRMLRLFMGMVTRSLCFSQELLLEILALRQQLAVLKGQRCRPRLTTPDRVFWVMLRRFWSGWKRALVIVRPETVVAPAGRVAAGNPDANCRVLSMPMLGGLHHRYDLAA